LWLPQRLGRFSAAAPRRPSRSCIPQRARPGAGDESVGAITCAPVRQSADGALRGVSSTRPEKSHSVRGASARALHATPSCPPTRKTGTRKALVARNLATRARSHFVQVDQGEGCEAMHSNYGLQPPGYEHAVARVALLTSTTTHEKVRRRKSDSRGSRSQRLVDAERSGSVYVRPREDALIAVGGVTALPAAPREDVIGLCGLWSNRALGPETFRSCPPLPRWVRPIAAQTVSAALWVTSKDGDWKKLRAALWLFWRWLTSQKDGSSGL
jgi:hypothetical protein